MCAGCMGTADFLLTGGVLGAASLKVAGRRLLPGWRDRSPDHVTDAEADAFVARLRRRAPAAEAPDAAVDDALDRCAARPSSACLVRSGSSSPDGAPTSV